MLDRLGCDAEELENQLLRDLAEAERPKKKKEKVGAGGRGRKGKKVGLAECGVDLTELARAGELDPCVGREEEIERLMRVLVRRRKCNPSGKCCGRRKRGRVHFLDKGSVFLWWVIISFSVESGRVIGKSIFDDISD